MRHRIVRLLGIGLVSLALASSVAAQPDPSQMSGLPLPDGELPDGTISVRVIRGQLTNNVQDHPVDLHQGDIVTDRHHRCQRPGDVSHAESRCRGICGDRARRPAYPVPAVRGTRARWCAPHARGRGRSDGACATGGAGIRDIWERIVDPDRAGRGNRRGLLPARRAQYGPGAGRAGGADCLRTCRRGRSRPPCCRDRRPGRSRRDRASSCPDRFPPGVTPLRVGYVLPYTSGSLVVSQRFPANLEALVMMVEKWGAMDVASKQISRRGDLSVAESGGTPYLLAGGPLIPAGEPLAFELTGLPHHNRMPTNLALVIAVGMLAIGDLERVRTGWVGGLGGGCEATSGGGSPEGKTVRRPGEGRAPAPRREDRVDQALDTASRAADRVGTRVSGARRSERCHHVIYQPTTSTNSRLTTSRVATGGGARSIGCR